MKPITCRHCGAIDKHHGFQCYTQLKPIKRNPVTKPICINKNKTIKIKPATARTPNMMTRSLPWLLNKAQEVFNAYIRLRDSKDGMFTCISCNKLHSTDQMHAGHYYSMGHHSYLRFNENNVHGECVRCNTFLHGNLLPYRQNLIKKIGQEEVDNLEAWCKFSHKWDKIQVIGIIQIYREKVKKIG